MALPQIASYTTSDPLPTGLTLQLDGTITGTIPPPSTDPAPTWVTASGLVLTDVEGSTVDIPLVATPYTGHTIDNYCIVYNYTLFVLPWGLLLNSTTGHITGTIAEIPYVESAYTYPIGQRPTWNPPLGPLLLAAFEFDVVSIYLSATANLGTSIVDYTVVDGFLPWGLTISRSNGRIYGTVAQLKNRTTASYVTKSPAPVWTTSSGTLGTFDELQSVSIMLMANALLGTTIVNYTLIAGALPWGLTLASNGAISGTTAQLTNRTTPSLPSPPIWTTTTLGTRALGSTINITLVASAQIGSIVRYQIVSGNLPWGLYISSNQVTGTISNLTNVAGTYTVEIRAIDTRGAYSDRNITIILT